MKNLPNNLKNLDLNMSFNNLGIKTENIKHLGILMKSLPNSL